MTDDQLAALIDDLKRRALEAVGGDGEAAVDAIARLAITQTIRLQLHGQRGYGRIPPDMPVAIAPKVRTEPL